MFGDQISGKNNKNCRNEVEKTDFRKFHYFPNFSKNFESKFLRYKFLRIIEKISTTKI